MIRRVFQSISMLGLVGLASLQAGCSASTAVSRDLPTIRAAGLLLPEAPSAGPAWFDQRLDDRVLINAGSRAVRTEIARTRIRGGLRVGFDGRVRDTLRVETRSESLLTVPR